MRRHVLWFQLPLLLLLLAADHLRGQPPPSAAIESSSPTEASVEPEEPATTTINPQDQLPRARHGASLACGQTNAGHLFETGGGERNLSRGQFPWLARISTDPRGLQHHCAAVVVGPRHLLTSAGCLKPCQRRPKLWVFVGDHSLQAADGESRHEVTQVLVHPDYKPFPATTANAIRHNIGLIKTKRQIRFRLTADGPGSVNRVCLPDADLVPGENLTLAGWSFPGRIDPLRPSDWPRAKEVLVRRKCPSSTQQQGQLGGSARVAAGLGLGSFCTSAQDLGGHCTGDPGAPLVRPKPDAPDQWELVGIVAYGRQTTRKNCAKKLPLVSTRVLYYQDWISRHLARRSRLADKKRKLSSKKTAAAGRRNKIIHMAPTHPHERAANPQARKLTRSST